MKKIYKYFRHFCFSSIPFITVLLGILFNILPLKIAYLNLLPLASSITIYFWSIYRSKSLSYVSLFFLGILKDILENNIIGLSALWFLLFKHIISFQINYIVNRSFLVVWAGFIFFLGVTLILPLVLLQFGDSVQTSKIAIILTQWIITIFAYIPAHWLLNKLKNVNFDK